MMNRGLIAIVGVGAAALVAWWVWPRGDGERGERGGSAATHDGGGGGGSTGTAGGGAAIDGGARSGPITQVTRLTPEERRTLGAQIAAARARARQRAVTDAGDVLDDGGVDQTDVVIPLERVQGDLKQSLEDSVKILADCYTQQPGGPGGRNPMVLLRMTSDPDFGTVIDTDEITDGEGSKLPPALDECLRDSIDTLALPPLGEGGKLDLQYSFRFDEDEVGGKDAP